MHGKERADQEKQRWVQDRSVDGGRGGEWVGEVIRDLVISSQNHWYIPVPIGSC